VAEAAPGAISAQEEAALGEAEAVSEDSAEVALVAVEQVAPGRENSKFKAPNSKQIQSTKFKI
jgi:hypothetical protein